MNNNLAQQLKECTDDIVNYICDHNEFNECCPQDEYFHGDANDVCTFWDGDNCVKKVFAKMLKNVLTEHPELINENIKIGN